MFRASAALPFALHDRHPHTSRPSVNATVLGPFSHRASASVVVSIAPASSDSFSSRDNAFDLIG